MKTAFYAGSFDPFTIGHLSIARRALELFDGLIIGIGINKAKRNETTIEERILKIKKLFGQNDKVKVFAYEGLTAVVARENGAGVLVRGVRNAIDFEKEKELADINLKVFSMPTVMFPAEPELSYVSSSMVRELAHFGFDPSEFLPNQ
ncbi:MAG: pantetheine-phosphate adenylyltransferase [Muribaculaceae bacterium]|nr:pantetheine-phosphate adenylyltransferase [Muribaculaceae bacterium]